MAAEFSAGSAFGPYVLDAYVGAGSFGQVWKAHKAETGEVVAIKLLATGVASQSLGGMRAEVELLAGAAVNRSQHIARVLAGGSDPVPHVVMEYVEGTDLAAMLAREGKLSAAKTIEVGLAIADALEALNAAQIVHRDIKPANVLVDTDGVVKLADFGIAKIVGYETMTITGQVAMTMAYAAPEVWEDDETTRFGSPGHRSDLYSLGVLLYQCLTGDTPFRGNYGVLYRAHRERRPDFAKLPPETPASLKQVIRLCLEKVQVDRPEDASQCGLMLQRALIEDEEARTGVLESEPARFGPWVRTAPHPERPWSWRCRYEGTDATATVEVLFTDDIEAGARLRRLKAVNEEFVKIGAERILDSNRLVLRPDESWRHPPQGAFQFWLAREDSPPPAAIQVTKPALADALRAALKLRHASLRNETPIHLSGELTVTGERDAYLGRPGIDATQVPFDEDLSSWLHGLPMDSDAASLVASAPNPADLMSWALDQSSATVSFDKATTEDGTVRGSFCPNCFAQAKPGVTRCDVCGGSLDQRTNVFSTQRVSLTTESAGAASQLVSTGGSAFELLLTSLDTQPLNLMLHGVSEGDGLHISVPPAIRLAPGATERVRVEVSPRKRRLYGRKTWQFSVVASSSGGRDLPPILANATFEEWRWLPLAAASVGGLAIATLVAAVVVLGGGSSKDTNETKSATAPDAPVATAEAAQALVTPESPAAAPAAAPAEPPTPAPPLPPPSLPGGAAPPPAQPAPASSGASQPAPAAPPAQNVPRALPTMAPQPTSRVCSTEAPKTDEEKFQGCRIFEAIFDGTHNNSFAGARGIGGCAGGTPDAAASTIQYLPGAVDLVLNKRGSQTSLNLNTFSRSSYALAYEISFASGSKSDQLITARTGGQQSIFLSVQAGNDLMKFVFWDGNISIGTDMSPVANLPGLGSGRRVTIGMAVSPSRLTAFVDGKLVLDVVDSRLPGPHRPGLNHQICPPQGSPATGTLRIHSARIYELAGQ